MALISRKNEGQDFDPAPEGIHNGICVDVIDMGIVEGPFGGKEKVRFVFELEAVDDQGRPFQVNEFFTNSVHPKSKLFKFLTDWRGRALTEEEQQGIDLEQFIGVSALLVIKHNQRDDRIFANINAIQRAQKRIAPSGCYDPQAARQRLARKQSEQQYNQQRLQRGVQQHQQAQQTMRQPQQQTQQFPPRQQQLAQAAQRPRPMLDVPMDDEQDPY